MKLFVMVLETVQTEVMNQSVVVRQKKNDNISMISMSSKSGINECASSVLSGCEHNCVNTLTSFKCTCRTGYKLAPNQKNCWGKIFLLVKKFSKTFYF